MHNENLAVAPRRSSRVHAAVPILVTSLEGSHFSEVCETLVVNAHGCAMRSSSKLSAGAALHFHSQDGKETTARVVSCQPLGPGSQSWMLGAKLDRAENFWGLPDCPKDWALSPSPGSVKVQAAGPRPPAPSFASLVPDHLSQAALTSQAAQVRNWIAESLRPLEVELAALKEKQGRGEANRSRFDVSLASIPPELEAQLEQRLRGELAPKMMEEARVQSARVLSAAQAAMDQRISAVDAEFQRRSAEELQRVEQRAHKISSGIVEYVRDQLRDGVADMQRKLADGRDQLLRTSDEILQSLQSTANAQHLGHMQDLEQVRAAAAAESSRLHQQVEQLDRRLGKLDESVRTLEAGFERRLGQLASDAATNTQDQLAAVAHSLLEQLTARCSQTLAEQMEETAANMKIVQRGILASVSDSLKAQAADALRAHEHSMEELTEVSFERWRQRIAGGLNALARNLGERIQVDGDPER